MNVKLLRRIQKHILAEPRRFAMKSWLQRKSEFDPSPKVIDHYRKSHPYPRCNTAACIAGWAALLSHPASAEEIHSWDIAHIASLALGVPVYSSPLFFADKWPKRFKVAYRKAKTPAMRARIAVRRIDHYIKTKGAE